MLNRTPPLCRLPQSVGIQLPVYLETPLFASWSLHWLALGMSELDLLAQNNDVTEAHVLRQKLENRYLKSGNEQPFLVFLALNGYATFFPAAAKLIGLDVSHSDSHQGQITGMFSHQYE